ncbi:FUN14 domain-containing protein 1 [Sarcoptes scabiei]|uniref:FUN14 domain-containing protein 1 n=1 Tax=Sarcoptes scabiei TaxID=52283 RepID=A0A834R9Z3_SARSC|nr:FUN14 domain-containing protein 1 [Sarcoptes scabiei]
MGEEIPITLNTSTTTESLLNRSNRSRRKSRQYIRTRRPREYGVASFLSADTNPISMNRVLLGMLVGFAQTRSQKVGELIVALSGKRATAEIENESLNPLLAVTLADLYGISKDDMVYSEYDNIFGAEGKWNNSICHTDYILNDNEGLWATLAEFRGGLDGYYIGLTIQSLASQLMNIKASQILRFYYSRQGLAANSGVCHRKLFIETSLNDDLVEEARKYLVIWNSFFLSGLHPQSKIDGYIESSKEKIFDLIRKTTQMNDGKFSELFPILHRLLIDSVCFDFFFHLHQEEKKLCLAIDRNVDIKDQPCETNSDVFFLLDVIKTCRPKQFCRQASMVRKLSKNLNMKRNHGSISIFYNAESMMNPYLLDDQMRIISPPLYSVLYNSTSSECAACKALYGDTSATRIIRNRVDLFEQIKRLMDQFDAIEQNRTGVPGKVFYWFDFGSVDNIPQETIQNIRYEKFRRHLLYLQRDINFFGISTNISTMTDIIKDRNRLAAVGPGGLGDTQAIQSLVDQSCQIQSVFQYNACHSTPSNQIVYEGYITPNYKQYWIMYPRHFIKSYRIEFKATVPERDEKKCRTNNEIDKDLILIVQNPCKEKTIENCPPIYFTITLHEPNGINQPCTNVLLSTASKSVSDKDGKLPEYFKYFLKNLKKSSDPEKLMIGAGAGIFTGYLSAKFGKLAAVAIGSSMLVMQIAQYKGYIKIDWKKFNQDVQVVTTNINQNKSRFAVLTDNVKTFAKENVVLVGSFTSGFLIGFAWA